MADIISIGEFQIARKGAGKRLTETQCRHKHLQLEDGDVVRCADCNVQVSAYWALESIAFDWGMMQAKLEHEKTLLAEAKKKEVHLLAARAIEKVWRSKDMLPCCPHCGVGIAPEDGLGMAQINRAIELRRRNIKP